MSVRPNRRLMAAVAGFAVVALLVAIARRPAHEPSRPSHLKGWSSD